jgi:hypothetical protein
MTTPRRRIARVGLCLLATGCVLAQSGEPIPIARAAAGDVMTLESVGQLGGGAVAVAVTEGHAYLAIGRRVQVLRLSDRRAPEPVGLFATAGTVTAVAAVGRYAYALEERGVLDILDVTEPAHPVRVGSLAGVGDGALAVAGDMLYASDGAWLVAVDVSDPARPTKAGRVLVHNDAGIRQIVLAGGVAHVAAYGAGLVTVDVSDPSQMLVLARLQPGGNVQGVAVSGGVAYLATVVPPEFPPLTAAALFGLRAPSQDGGCNLVVLDVRDPGNPRITQRLRVSGMDQGAVLEHRGRLFMLARWYGGPPSPNGGRSGQIEVFNLDVPAAPVRSALYGEEPSTGLAAEGDVLYEAGYLGGLRTLDISGPTSPQPLGDWRAPLDPRAIAFADGYAYVGDHELGGLWAVDAQTPAGAMPVAFVLGPRSLFCGAECALAVSEGIVYAADANSGLSVFSAQPPEQLRLVSTTRIRGQGNWMDIVVANGTAYLVVDEGDISGRPHGGVYILDVSDPSLSPTQIAHIQGFRPYRVAVDGAGNLLAVDRDGDLWIVDVTDPTHPATLAHLPLPDGAAGDVAVGDGYAYIAGRNAAFSVVDIRQPAAPRLIGHLAPADGEAPTATVTLLGTLAMVTGQQLVDVSHPDRPLIVDVIADDSDWQDGGRIVDQAAGDGLFVLADDERGVFFNRPIRRLLPARAFLPWGTR